MLTAKDGIYFALNLPFYCQQSSGSQPQSEDATT